MPNDSIAEQYRLKARHQSDTALMMAFIDSAILYKPSDIWARNWRVDVYRALGQDDSAYMEMKRVLASCHSKKDSTTILSNYIWDLASMPHKEEHPTWVSEYVRLTADSSRVYAHLAFEAWNDPSSLEHVEGYLRSAVRTANAKEAEVHRENLVYYLLSHEDLEAACVEYCQIEKTHRVRMESLLVTRCVCDS